MLCEKFGGWERRLDADTSEQRKVYGERSEGVSEMGSGRLRMGQGAKLTSIAKEELSR